MPGLYFLQKILHAGLILQFAGGQSIIHNIGHGKRRASPAIGVDPAFYRVVVAADMIGSEEIDMGALGSAAVNKLFAKHGNGAERFIRSAGKITAYKYTDQRAEYKSGGALFEVHS